MRVAFFGTPDFALPVLRALQAEFEVALVVSQPDRAVGRGLKLTAPPVAAHAREHGLPLLQPRRLRGEAFAPALRASGAEVAVTCAYGRLLPPEVLAVPPRGFLNAHTSLLPELRGAAPIQWALIRGLTVTGTTVMLTDEGMDTGPILAQESLDIGAHWTAPELAHALSEQAAGLMVRTLHRLDALKALPQNHAHATHAPLLSKEDGFVRWSDRAEDVYNRYRGVFAWPRSTAFVGEGRVIVTRMEPGSGAGAPGEVLATGERGVEVACGEGSVWLLELQPAARRPQNAAAFARETGLRPGTRLPLFPFA